MELKYDSLMDFIKCPALYKFKHRDNISLRELIGRDYLNNILIKTIYYFYNTILDEDRIPKEKEIIDVWSDLYVMKEKQLIFKNPTMRKEQLNYAREYLKKFYLKHKYNPGIPIGIDIRYDINIGNHKITNGKLQLIRIKDDKTQLVFFDNGRYIPDDFRRDNDIRFSLMAYAYRNIFKIKEEEFLYTHSRKAKEINVFRNQADFKKMINALDSIGKAIENNLFWQRISYLCKSCPYNEICTKWDGR